MEKMKEQQLAGQIASQALLIPEIVELPADQIEALLQLEEVLHSLGLYLEGLAKGGHGSGNSSAIIRCCD